MATHSKKELPICRQCPKQQTCRVSLMPTDLLTQICPIVKAAELRKKPQQVIVSFRVFSTLKSFINLHIN